MTLEETRQLGIEFERRVQTMIPEKEYLDKLDTDTIYAYLNSYQDKYIHDIYRNLDQIKSGSKLSAHVEAVLQEMLRTQTIPVSKAKNYTRDITDENGTVIVENGRSVTYPLDPSFYMYVRSVSNVSSTYSYKNNGDNVPIRVIPNELVSQSDIWRLLETPHNSLRILRYPAAAIGPYEKFLVEVEPTVDTPTNPEPVEMSFPTLNVIYDQYTTPEGIKIVYYAQPQHFDIMTSTRCELPMDAFDDIVTGAVDLYVQYVAGAEANKRRIQEAQRQQAKDNDKRRNNNEDED